MTKKINMLNSSDFAPLAQLRDCIENLWVVKVRDITYETDAQNRRIFSVMLETLADFDRVSGRNAATLRKSERTALAYALNALGLRAKEVNPALCSLRFGATFEDGVRNFIYGIFAEKYAAPLKKKYFDPESMTRFSVDFGRVFVVFAEKRDMDRFISSGKAQALRDEAYEALKSLDSFSCISDAEQHVLFRTAAEAHEILPDEGGIAPSQLGSTRFDDVCEAVGKYFGTEIACVRYHFSAQSLLHDFTLIPRTRSDCAKITRPRFRAAEESICTALRERLGGDVGRGEIVACRVYGGCVADIARDFASARMQHNGDYEKVRERFYNKFTMKDIEFDGTVARPVMRNALFRFIFERSAAFRALDGTMRALVQSYDDSQLLEDGSFVECVTVRELSQQT